MLSHVTNEKSFLLARQVFTNSDSLWSELDVAGASERDRVWRMPLDEGYMAQIGGTGYVAGPHEGPLAIPY